MLAHIIVILCWTLGGALGLFSALACLSAFVTRHKHRWEPWEQTRTLGMHGPLYQTRTCRRCGQTDARNVFGA